jgi:hypothetical protein
VTVRVVDVKEISVTQSCLCSIELQAHLHIVLSEVTYIDRLYGLVVRVPGYRTEMYCVSCEVRTGFIYVM